MSRGRLAYREGLPGLSQAGETGLGIKGPDFRASSTLNPDKDTDHEGNIISQRKGPKSPFSQKMGHLTGLTKNKQKRQKREGGPPKGHPDPHFGGPEYTQ